MTPVQAVVVCGVGIAYAGLFFWLIGVVHALREDVDAARDETDRALGGVLAVHDHLAGAEPAGTGRHAERLSAARTVPVQIGVHRQGSGGHKPSQRLSGQGKGNA